MILDTDVCCRFMRHDKLVVRRLLDHKRYGEILRIPAIVVYEISYGIATVGGDPRFLDWTAALEKMLGLFDPASLTGDIATDAAQIQHELAVKDQQISPFDSIIAATAKWFDEPLLTFNVDHFSRVDFLKIQILADWVKEH